MLKKYKDEITPFDIKFHYKVMAFDGFEQEMNFYITVKKSFCSQLRTNGRRLGHILGDQLGGIRIIQEDADFQHGNISRVDLKTAYILTIFEVTSNKIYRYIECTL